MTVAEGEATRLPLSSLNKSGAPRAANTNPSSMRAPILVALPSTRERDVLSVAKGQQVFGDEVTAVIRVHPEYGDGNNPRARSSACTTPCRVRCRSGKHFVHVVAVSVNVNVRRKAPSVVPPQWATRLILEEPRLDAAPLGKTCAPASAS